MLFSQEFNGTQAKGLYLNTIGSALTKKKPSLAEDVIINAGPSLTQNEQHFFDLLLSDSEDQKFEEVYLAEKLIEINPWADMVRFARTGGEANAMAIRIARAASGKDKVAVCGYHGWHDWYLSVNLNDTGDDLSNHLLPGLDPKGVPSELKNSVIPFEYNDYEGLEKIGISGNDAVLVVGLGPVGLLLNFRSRVSQSQGDLDLSPES